MFAIHSVLILRENILFLEEWVKYHQSIGITHFYLYDNSGSTGSGDPTQLGQAITTTGKNKYGFNILELTSHLSDSDVNNIAKDICSRYPIKIIEWKPTIRGNIVYKQVEACIDCVEKFKHEVNWIAFIDIDEFLIIDRDSKTPRNLNDLLLEWNKNNISKIIINQVKFKDRFLEYKETGISSVKNITERTILDTTGWAQKCIINTKNFISTISSIHDLRSSGKEKHYSLTEFSFNHYNMNETTRTWMKTQTWLMDRPLSIKDDYCLKNRL
jgi:hypothetical protein